MGSSCSACQNSENQIVIQYDDGEEIAFSPTLNSYQLMNTSRRLSMLRQKTSQMGMSPKKQNSQSFRDFQILAKTTKIEDSYELGEVIGRGMRGSVKTTLHLLTQEQRAVKCIRKSFISDIGGFVQEINALQEISHPSILHFYELFQDDTKYFLIFELCKGGDLLEKIIANESFSEQYAANILQQILSVLRYLHNKKIYHKCLRTESILLKKSTYQSEIKVTDISMGFRSSYRKILIENPQYASPEILRNKDIGEKTDVWSCGVILYTMLMGYLPFQGTNQEIYQQILQSKLTFPKSSISKEAQFLIRFMLKPNHRERATVEQVLKSKWMEQQQATISLPLFGQMAFQNMKNFGQKDQHNKNAIIQLCCLLSTQEERAALEEQFRRMDKNNDGMLSQEELINGYKSAFGENANEKLIEQLFKTIDVDGSGFIDFNEFVAATIESTNLLNQHKLQQLFKTIDKNNRNKITLYEFKNALASIKRSSVNFIDSLFPGDGQQEIDYLEFMKMLKDFHQEEVSQMKISSNIQSKIESTIQQVIKGEKEVKKKNNFKKISKKNIPSKQEPQN